MIRGEISIVDPAMPGVLFVYEAVLTRAPRVDDGTHQYEARDG